ncbi:hypothetical protein [Xanthomonas graminis]|uniref:hypothetical protein n=1 Tax=Xanthomonas graminis TaxID=3390026 RepID=UPI001187304C|nr:hypothetical protein [Xanthomonas translucens]
MSIEVSVLPMPAKPHETSFPEQTFTVKDRYGLDSKQGGLDQASGCCRHLYRQSVALPGDSAEDFR